MIQPNEIRIGNAVHVDGLHGSCEMTVAAITRRGTLHESQRVIFFKEDNEAVGEFLSDCSGIELTNEQQLFSMGFKKHNNENPMWEYYGLPRNEFEGDDKLFFIIQHMKPPFEKTKFKFTFQQGGLSYMCDVESIHKLQNICYFTQGIELTWEK